jgi:hypothetical protein
MRFVLRVVRAVGSRLPAVAVAIAIPFSVHCGEGPVDLSYDIVGTWTAEFTQAGNIYDGSQLVPTQIKYDMTLTFRPDYSFRMNFVFAALGLTRTATPEDGVYFIKDDRIAITSFAVEPSDLFVNNRLGTYRIEGNQLVLEGIFRGAVPPFTREQ